MTNLLKVPDIVWEIRKVKKEFSQDDRVIKCFIDVQWPLDTIILHRCKHNIIKELKEIFNDI
jgi:hypothetical protein